MKSYVKYSIVLVLLGALICVRLFENQLFYDPYIMFFKSDYLQAIQPEVEMPKLVLHTTLRYILNALISLAIIAVLFGDKTVLKFSAYVYSIAFVVLLTLFLYFLNHLEHSNYYMFFTIRRFLIQPILLLLLVAALYYYKLKFIR